MKTFLKRTHAFTLIELLTVIAIIAILAGLLFPAIQSSMKKAEGAKAQTAIHSLATALSAYYTEYGKWPIAYAGAVPAQYEDFIVDHNLIALLSGQDPSSASYLPTPNPIALMDTSNDGLNYGPSTGTVQGNPRKIVFLEFKQADIKSSASIDNKGFFADPWGKPYHFRLDVNYQNQIDYPFAAAGKALPGVGFLIWSAGPDGQYKQNDVVSTVSPLVLTSQDPKNKDNVKNW